MPALPLQGRSLRKGVRFSVQTTSRGSMPCSKYSDESESLGFPSGRKVNCGREVRVESMKFIEAQKRPERALFSVVHRAKDLAHLSIGTLEAVPKYLLRF